MIYTQQRGGLYFQSPTLTPELEAELVSLLYAHHEEVAPFPDIPLDVDWPTYRSATALGTFRLFTMRRLAAAPLAGAPDIYLANTDLLGYAGFVITNSSHYRSSLQALCDLIYIVPSHRGYAPLLFRWCDDRLRELGVQVVYHHVTRARDFGPMLERLDYEFIEHTYARRLDNS